MINFVAQNQLFFMAKQDYKPFQVRVSPSDVDRLTSIAHNYGFRSVYGLLRWVVFTFLRAADPSNDPVLDPLPLDIIEVFNIKEDAQLVHESCMRVRRQNRMRNYMRERRAREKEKGDPITAEIDEMFQDCMAAGATLDYQPNIVQRKGK